MEDYKVTEWFSQSTGLTVTQSRNLKDVESFCKEEWPKICKPRDVSTFFYDHLLARQNM